MLQVWHRSPRTHSPHERFPPAARVIMVHVDELPFLKRLVAHRARGALRREDEGELFLG
jgi:hypothetical protein